MKGNPTILSELAKEQLSPINLYELTMLSGVILRYAQADQDIVFDGKTYDSSVPIEKEAVRSSTEGGIDNVRVAIANADQNITLILAQNDGLRGARLVIFTVFDGLLGDPDNKIVTFDGRIVAVKVTNSMVLFEVLSVLDVQYKTLPGRIFRADRCQWIYKEVDTCKYAGELSTCDKVLEGENGCRAHDNVKNFGGFPGIPELRTTIF